MPLVRCRKQWAYSAGFTFHWLFMMTHSWCLTFLLLLLFLLPGFTAIWCNLKFYVSKRRGLSGIPAPNSASAINQFKIFEPGFPTRVSSQIGVPLLILMNEFSFLFNLKQILSIFLLGSDWNPMRGNVLKDQKMANFAKRRRCFRPHLIPQITYANPDKQPAITISGNFCTRARGTRCRDNLK